jgi:hypothetical protein
MSYTTSNSKYFIEHDNFFKYIKEYLKEESTHRYYKVYTDNDNAKSNFLSSDSESDSDDFEYY